MIRPFVCATCGETASSGDRGPLPTFCRICARPPRRRAARITAADMDRFMSKVDSSAGPDACWPWLANSNRLGYGVFWVDRAQHQAPRVALTVKLGRDLQAGELALHHCDNPACVNPIHIYAGSVSDNARDMVSRGRQPAHMRPGYRQGRA